MGWYTFVTGELDFCKETYNSLDDVELDIKESKNLIEKSKRNLAAYAIANPKDIFSEDESGEKTDIITEANYRVDEAFLTLDEEFYRLFKLEFLKDNFTFRSGDFVRGEYYKYTGEDSIIFKKDSNYLARQYKESWGNQEWYAIELTEENKGWISIKKEVFEKNFTKLSKEEQDKINSGW